MDDDPVTEADLEHLLAGETGQGSGKASALSGFFREVRSSYLVDPPTHLAEDHIARLVAAARLQARLTTQPTQARSPQASGPLASNPLASGPLASNPLASGPLASNALASNALASNPLASNPLASNALASNALASGIQASNPLASGHLASGTRAGRPAPPAGSGPGSDALRGGPVRPNVRPLAPSPRHVEWRRKAMASGVFGSVTVKVLAGVMAAAAATGGLAAAGKLPTPLQNAVAGAAGGIGVSLPNPQALAASKAQAAVQAHAAVEAQKVVSTVSGLVQQVTAAADTSAPLTISAARSAGTCAQNVTALASQLSSLAALARTADLAQALAAHATALAQESVGCALPVASPLAAVTGAAGHTAPPKDAVLSGGASRVIATAIQACAPQLTSAIQALVQTALTATSAAQLPGLDSEARTVAGAAQACAQGVGNALQGILPALPSSIPTLPVQPPAAVSSSLSQILTVVPHPAAPPATGPAATGGSAPTGPTSAAMDWTSLLANLPQMPSPRASSGGPSGTQSWTGLTGSWTMSGSWSPFMDPPAPTATTPRPTATTSTSFGSTGNTSRYPGPSRSRG